MRLALILSVFAFALSAPPALACSMVVIDGQTVVSPKCPSTEQLQFMEADGFATTNRFFNRVCGDRKLSVYTSKHPDGTNATLSIVTTSLSDTDIRHDYTDAIMARLLPTHDIHAAQGQCFDSGTQIGLHIPGNNDQALNLLLSEGRVMDDFDRRARGEWLDQQPGTRRKVRHSFRVSCDGDGSPEGLRKCVERLKSDRE